MDGLWAVVQTGTKCFIAKLQGYETDAYDQVKKDFDEGKSFILTPAYDFFSPLRPVQSPNGQPGFSREPIITPFDFTKNPVPIRCKLNMLVFIDELEGDDAKLYRTFISQTEDTLLRSRAASHGLVLPDGALKNPRA